MFFVQEIEAIEEQWRTESAELVTAVARLQDENKRLRRTINSPADGMSIKILFLIIILLFFF